MLDEKPFLVSILHYDEPLTLEEQDLAKKYIDAVLQGLSYIIGKDCLYQPFTHYLEDKKIVFKNRI